MLVLAPATCCLGGIAADQILNAFCKSIRPEEGSGGWVGLVKKWLDGEEAVPANGADPADSKPAVSSTSSTTTGKRHKTSAKVKHVWLRLSNVSTDSLVQATEDLCQDEHSLLTVLSLDWSLWTFWWLE